MALFLDTTVVIDVLRGAEFAPALVQREPLLISPITVHEVLLGMWPDEERMTLELFEGLLVVALGPPEARMSGLWRRTTQDRNDPGPGGHAHRGWRGAHGLPLATDDVKDFPMPELRGDEQWPPLALRA